MNNYAIARVFTRIADLMEVRGDNVFKIRAYRNAASTMQGLTESLEVLAQRGELETIPGVGGAIADKTQDIIRTGTTPLLEKLRGEIPEGLPELTRIPGLGPKKLNQLWKELNISDLDGLEEAALAGRIRDLSGFTAKSEAALIEKIRAYRKRRERAPIGEILPYAQALRSMMESEAGVQQAVVAGSLRRWSDTAAGVDLLVATEEPEGLLDRLAEHPEFLETLGREPGALTVRTAGGAVADLRAVTPDRFAWNLFITTGSAEHVAQVMERLADPPAAETASSEEEIYGLAGLPLMPCELREGRGEVAAAAAGALPRRIELSDYRGALHAHSTWSDGAASILAMAQAALEMGHEYLAITDHSQSLAMAGGLNAERLRLQGSEIAQVNEELGGAIRVLRGIECDILANGEMDLPADVLREVDWVVGSVHVQQRMPRDEMTARIVSALRTGLVDLLGHPTGRILGHRDPYEVDLDAVFAAAAEEGVAMEINAFPDRLDLNDVNAKRALDYGLKISINPDAHRPHQLGLLNFGLSQARRGWVEPAHVLNCMPRDELLKWIGDRRRRKAASTS